MSLTLETNADPPPASRTLPATSTSSTTQTTSSSSTTSVSVSTSSRSSSSTTSSSTTTSYSSTTSTAQAQTTAQSLSESSSTTSWPVSSTSSRTSTSQSSVSQASTTTSTAAVVATGASSPDPTITLNPPPSTRQHGTLIVAESTLLATASTYEVPFTSQAFNTQSVQNIAPTTTSAPGPTSTSVTETPDRAAHRLIIDLGECAGFTSPRLMLESGDLGDLVAIGKGRFAIELKSELSSGIFGAVLSLKDNGVRCGNGDAAACTAVHLSFGLTSGVFASVLRAGDYSVDMYPFGMWLEDGVTWGAQLVNSPDTTYHCWGWSQEECPYAFANGGDADWTASSDNPTGIVYIGFCPSDGPDWSKIPPNPNPQSFEPDGEATYIELPTQTVLSTSTFLTAITPTKLSVPITSEPPCEPPALSCVFPNTFISEDVTSTIWSEFITPPGQSTILFSTAIVIHTTSTVPQTTTFLNNPVTTSFLSSPTPTVTSWMVESTDFENSSTRSEWTFSTVTEPRTRRRPTATASSRSDTPISTPPPTVVPTYSDITDSLGSVVSTLSYDVPVSSVVSPAPTITSAPNSQYVITSWTTWMTVNGSTVPAIAGEVGILSTIPITYMLEPSTIIPVAEISSRSVESIRTSSPSATIAASSDNDQTKQNQGGKIAGAVVGTLVGLVLGSLLLWYIFYRRQRRQRLDHFARGDPAWLAPRYENGSGGGSRLLVDLDEEPRMRNSYVEPWVAPRSVAQTSSGGKASQREMENVSGGHGVSTVAGPSREVESSSNEGGSSWFQPESSDNHVPVAAVTRPGKSIARNEPTRRPDLVLQRPVPSHYHTPSLANPSLSLLPTPFQNEPPSPLTPPSPPSQAALIPSRVSPPPRAEPSQRRYVDDEEQVRHNAIPPLYNEAWNTGR
ncbi:hypothetical protein B0J17DRAFT_159506 [Rhizoctonia solani]|nr:hypothetical protein B0J17DRAFT_159506 [Rhizoctonia solani]